MRMWWNWSDETGFINLVNMRFTVPPLMVALRPYSPYVDLHSSISNIQNWSTEKHCMPTFL